MVQFEYVKQSGKLLADSCKCAIISNFKKLIIESIFPKLLLLLLGLFKYVWLLSGHQALKG